MKLFLLLILAGVMGCSTVREIGKALRGPTVEEACGDKTGDRLTLCIVQWQADRARDDAERAAFFADHNPRMNALQAPAPADPSSALIMRCGGRAVDFVTGRCL